jgi:hypothetical protein
MFPIPVRSNAPAVKLIEAASSGVVDAANRQPARTRHGTTRLMIRFLL